MKIKVQDTPHRGDKLEKKLWTLQAFIRVITVFKKRSENFTSEQKKYAF